MAHRHGGRRETESGRGRAGEADEGMENNPDQPVP